MSRPYVWAHRGAAGYAPENTLEAFSMAAQMGADGVELDVQLSKDGQIVVCHDEKVNRTSDGKGWVRDFTLEELKQMDFSGGNEKYAGVKIPTLEEVLELLRDTGMYVDIELKTSAYPYLGIEKKCIKLVREMGYEERVHFSSFNYLSLQKIRLYARNMPTGYLFLHASPSIVGTARKVGATAMNISCRNLQTEGFVEKCKENDMQINVWTVNKEREMHLCMEYDINAVITDYPDKIMQIRDQIDVI